MTGNNRHDLFVTRAVTRSRIGGEPDCGKEPLLPQVTASSVGSSSSGILPECNRAMNSTVARTWALGDPVMMALTGRWIRVRPFSS